jgi:hypothetical protein
VHGVSFASAASGYDDLTANISVKPLKTFLFASNPQHYMYVFFICFFFFFCSVWLDGAECITRIQTAGVFFALQNPPEKGGG